jgi:hypothetical protein
MKIKSIQKQTTKHHVHGHHWQIHSQCIVCVPHSQYASHESLGFEKKKKKKKKSFNKEKKAELGRHNAPVMAMMNHHQKQ